MRLLAPRSTRPGNPSALPRRGHRRPPSDGKALPAAGTPLGTPPPSQLGCSRSGARQAPPRYRHPRAPAPPTSPPRPRTHRPAKLLTAPHPKHPQPHEDPHGDTPHPKHTHESPGEVPSRRDAAGVRGSPLNPRPGVWCYGEQALPTHLRSRDSSRRRPVPQDEAAAAAPPHRRGSLPPSCRRAARGSRASRAPPRRPPGIPAGGVSSFGTATRFFLPSIPGTFLPVPPHGASADPQRAPPVSRPPSLFIAGPGLPPPPPRRGQHRSASAPLPTHGRPAPAAAFAPPARPPPAHLSAPRRRGPRSRPPAQPPTLPPAAPRRRPRSPSPQRPRMGRAARRDATRRGLRQRGALRLPPKAAVGRGLGRPGGRAEARGAAGEERWRASAPPRGESGGTPVVAGTGCAAELGPSPTCVSSTERR